MTSGTAWGAGRAPILEKRYPHAEEALGPAFQAAVPRGGMLLFSGTQLHGTVGHDCPQTRWSCEIRTVRVDHVAELADRRRIDDRCRGSTLPELVSIGSFTNS